MKKNKILRLLFRHYLGTVSIIALTGLMSCNAHSNNSVYYDPSATLEANIASNMIPLTNNNSFDELDRYVKNKRIVILGEAGHWDGATFEVKVNWIKHLHEKCGFDVIALEGLPSLPAYLSELKDFQCPWDIYDIWRVWSLGRENRVLMAMIKSNQLTAVGIDMNSSCIVSGSTEFLYPDQLRLALQRIDTEHIYKIDWERLNRLYRKYLLTYTQKETISSGQMAEMMDLFNQIEQYAALLSEKHGINTDAIQLSLRNNKTFLKSEPYNPVLLSGFTYPSKVDINSIHIFNNYRDRQMADNLIWYLDRHPDKKVIVWCANFHGARNISEIDYSPDSTLYYRTQLMGEHLANKYGNNLYSVAFTSSQQIDQNAPIGNLEQELAKSNSNYGFIDFTALRYHPDYFGKKFNSNIILKKDGRFLSVWDGVYFIRKQHLPTQQK